ncbi:DUF3108 domain-containing protein [Hymenobacter sp. BRD67]|uniref:DUF3108 domain-containing protein n=1 Tax=Hymenobacter sp. BRD67 TaxID=2675877 RepID=UPI001563F382|nr:DUF3108 domain-containing protein [Hymenobacter sp. BRD67]QKG53692.1 DUF3108 domain-containing protein [Hymenobacter sp. BRD67]
MPRCWLVIPLLWLCAAATQPPGTAEPVRLWPNTSFKTGETIRYKVHYGVINAAEAVVETSGSLERVADRPCYKATVSGRTTGSFDFFLHVKDQWRAYIDTASILPLRSTRDIEESAYRKKEVVDFDQAHAIVNVLQTHRKDPIRYTFKVPNNVQELVSGFYYLRTLNYDHMKPGEVIHMGGYFDESTFNLEVVFKGREIVETKAGPVHVLKLVPRLPTNRIFRGEDAIKVYLSDDRNKIPVLFQAEMFVGAVKVDMYKYEGLKSRLNMVRQNPYSAKD